MPVTTMLMPNIVPREKELSNSGQQDGEIRRGGTYQAARQCFTQPMLNDCTI